MHLQKNRLDFLYYFDNKIAVLDPNSIERDVSAMTNNIIRHDKGLKKQLINLALKIRNSSANVNGTKKRIVCIKKFYNEFNPCNGNNVNNSITLHASSIFLIDSTIDGYEHTYPVTIRRKHAENMIIETHYNNT